MCTQNSATSIADTTRLDLATSLITINLEAYYERYDNFFLRRYCEAPHLFDTVSPQRHCMDETFMGVAIVTL